MQTKGEFVAREAKRKAAAEAAEAACVTAAARVGNGATSGSAGGVPENLRSLFPALAGQQTGSSTDDSAAARKKMPLEAAELRRVAAAAAAVPSSPLKPGIAPGAVPGIVPGRGVVEEVALRLPIDQQWY